MSDPVPRTCTEIGEDGSPLEPECAAGESVDWRGILAGDGFGAGSEPSPTPEGFRESSAYVLLGAPGAGSTSHDPEQIGPTFTGSATGQSPGEARIGIGRCRFQGGGSGVWMDGLAGSLEALFRLRSVEKAIEGIRCQEPQGDARHCSVLEIGLEQNG